MQIQRMNMRITKKEIVHPDLSYLVTGLLYETHNELGRFCREKQYQDTFEKKLKENSIPYRREMTIPIAENTVSNRVDFCIDDKILIEFKTKPFLTKTDYFQIKRYLQTSQLRLGLLVNFRTLYLHPKRVLNTVHL